MRDEDRIFLNCTTCVLIYCSLALSLMADFVHAKPAVLGDVKKKKKVPRKIILKTYHIVARGDEGYVNSRFQLIITINPMVISL